MTKRSLSKLKKKLAKKLKKREKHPRPVAVDLSPASGRLMRRMARDHVDVLQNIEFVIVEHYRRNDDLIDDATVMKALKGSLLGEIPDESPVGDLVGLIAGMREVRSDVSDNLWHDALRTLMRSVRNHSRLQTGETGYLDFVGSFVPAASD